MFYCRELDATIEEEPTLTSQKSLDDVCSIRAVAARMETLEYIPGNTHRVRWRYCVECNDSRVRSVYY